MCVDFYYKFILINKFIKHSHVNSSLNIFVLIFLILILFIVDDFCIIYLHNYSWFI